MPRTIVETNDMQAASADPAVEEVPPTNMDIDDVSPTANSNTNTPPTQPPQIAAANLNLENIKRQFNPEGMLRSSRSSSTFNSTQRENEKLIFWLYENHSEFLVEDFCHYLQDVDSTIDYSPIMPDPKQKYRYKTTVEQRKINLRETILRKEISDALGPGGIRPTTPTINFDAFTETPLLFVNYIQTKVKADGKLMKPGVYSGFHTNLNNLFRRYRYRPKEEYTEELTKYMDGVKHIANKANQAGEGNIWSGSRHLPWDCYRWINRELFKMGSSEGVFGAAFSKLTVNLACRGDNTGQVCTKHLGVWSGDSFGVPFAHEKRNQKGDDEIRKLPRQCYCNPLDFSSDIMSSLFHYMCMNPDVMAHPNGQLFPGSGDASSTSFSRVLKKVLEANVNEDGTNYCETEFSVAAKDITMHSMRKTAHTHMNCGSTAGPTSAAVCIREGHPISGVRNKYIAQEMASDEICGKILSGLPINKPEFAVSYPDFIPIDIEASLRGRGVSDRVYALKKKEVDRQVRLVLDSIFGHDNMRNFPLMHKFLRIGLAAHLIHIKEIEELLPANAKLRATPLFTNPLVKELAQHVRIAMPWEDHHIYFADATGLPPHVLILAQLRSQEDKIEKIPGQIEAMLEEKQMNGPISLAQMKKINENSPTVKGLVAAVTRIEAVLERRFVAAEPGQVENFTGGIGTRYDLFNHDDGIQRRIPPDWKIPMLSIQHMYLQWHCGDQANRISPIKNLDKTDMSKLKKRAAKSFCELKRLMGAIDKAAADSGVPPKKVMTLVEATSCFLHGKHGLNIPTTTPQGRPRNVERLTWSSAIRYLPTRKK